ncbi:hypothetical protein [Faecalibaculum rodentium]|uniref:hypothetical protein n=1 Tax=Faecalibaculum rodentium TaxID=1702221 RepID=UPI002729F64B|nr:hypothetical protein [Faecalibaculum rodentium]
MTRKQEMLAEAEERLDDAWFRIDAIRNLHKGDYEQGIDAALRVITDVMNEITAEYRRAEE